MASHFFGGSVYFLEALYFLIVGATENTPESIADGLFISEGTFTTDIRSLQRQWTLYVIIGKSSARIPWILRYLVFTTLFPIILPTVVLTEARRHTGNSASINFLRPIAPLTVSSRERSRRVLIDVGGQLLDQDFGVATSEQIETSRDMILLVRTSNKTILHQSNKMVTVINQTYHEIISHRKHIVKVETALSKFNVHVQSWIALHNVAL